MATGSRPEAVPATPVAGTGTLTTTVTLRTPLAKVLLPLYVAVTRSLPGGRLVVVHLASPLTRATSWHPPMGASENDTVPVGIPESSAAATVAVIVTGLPRPTVMGDAVTVITTPRPMTVSVKLWVALGATPLVAVMVKGKVPALPSAGVPARVAVPSPLSVNVTPDGSVAPPSERVSVGRNRWWSPGTCPPPPP